MNAQGKFAWNRARAVLDRADKGITLRVAPHSSDQAVIIEFAKRNGLKPQPAAHEITS